MKDFVTHHICFTAWSMRTVSKQQQRCWYTERSSAQAADGC